MMTEPYLTTVLEEAEHVAERHDRVARTTDGQAHEYLRYAVLRVLEGEAERLPADWTPMSRSRSDVRWGGVVTVR